MEVILWAGRFQIQLSKVLYRYRGKWIGLLAKDYYYEEELWWSKKSTR